MAEGTISIGATTLDTPLNYIHHPDKFIVAERTLNATLQTTRPVTSEDQPIDKYRFEITHIVDSRMYELKEEARHISNLDYIDYFPIVEVLSGDGSTKTFYTQRKINTTTGMIVTVNDVDMEIGVDVTVTQNDSGRGKLVFGTAPTDVDDNIVIRYVPTYVVQIVDHSHVFYVEDVAYYTLICQEV